MTTLYQKDQKGNIKIWTIEVINNFNHCVIFTTDGIQGGAMTPNETIIDKGKGGRSILEQACSEMDSKIKKKIKSGYVDDINNVQEAGVLGSGNLQPMLAQKHDPTGKQNSSKTLKQIGILNKRVGVQDKKDGNRCNPTVKCENGVFSCTLATRKGEPFAPLPHIENQIIEAFKKIYNYVNTKYGVTEYTIDGELMPGVDENGVKLFSFNKLNGLVKNYSRTPEQEELVKTITFHVYDVMLPVGYETRDKVKDYFKGTHLKPLKTTYVVATDEILRELLEDALSRGEEGIMIRQLDIPYENKRTWQLVKYKLFQDEEFEVVGVEESVKKGMTGALICKLNTPGKDRDGNIITTFKAAMKFSHEERKEIWENRDSYIGQQVTVEFFEYSEYKIPRFPKAKAFRANWDK